MGAHGIPAQEFHGRQLNYLGTTTLANLRLGGVWVQVTEILSTLAKPCREGAQIRFSRGGPMTLAKPDLDVVQSRFSRGSRFCRKNKQISITSAKHTGAKNTPFSAPALLGQVR